MTAWRDAVDAIPRCPHCGEQDKPPPAKPTLEPEQNGSLTCNTCSANFRYPDHPKGLVMPKLLPLLLLALVLTASPILAGCRSVPATVVTPAGKAAYAADQVVVRVNELMNAAIAAQAQGALPLAAARPIVKWTIAADQTLAAVPAGWPDTLRAGWIATKQQLPAITNPAILAAMGAVDLVLGVL